MGFFLTDHPHPTPHPRLFSSAAVKTTTKSSLGRKGFISTYSLQGIMEPGQEFVSGPDLVPSFFLLFSFFEKKIHGQSPPPPSRLNWCRSKQLTMWSRGRCPRSKHGLHIQWHFPQIAQSTPRNESRALSDSLWWILECPTLYWREWSLVALGPAGRNDLMAGIWLQHGPQASFCVIRGEAPWCWHLPLSSSHLLTVLPAGKAKRKTTVTLTERFPMFLSLSRDAQVIELWVASCIGRGFRCFGSEHPRLVMDHYMVRY